MMNSYHNHFPNFYSVSTAISGALWFRSEEAGTSKSSLCSWAGSSSTKLLFLSLAIRGTHFLEKI